MPEIMGDRYSITVEIFSTKEKFEEEKIMELNERQEKALEYLKDHRRITNREYQGINKTSRETAKRELSDLVKKGILKQIGSGRGTFYQL
ncbi:MAG: hypothetical protein KAU03_05730 [Candidatus Altiarchaeales archaeon]|nr:hypothetical protein [Candidatus Altiarchaeales archaeon]